MLKLIFFLPPEAWAAILDSLFGALVGSVTGYLANRVLRSQEAGAEAAIRRKNKLYTPIFNELCDLKTNLEQYPFREHIYLEEAPRTEWPQPVFKIWIEMKRDTRHMYVRRDATDALEFLLNQVMEYNDLRK